MTEAVRAAIHVRSGPDVAGYLEAVTESAALGWVWQPGSDARLMVELRVDDQVLSTARADGMREDLARSGIGDGQHAFILPIPEAKRSRANEMRVFVIREGEAATALNAAPMPTADVDRLADVQRGVAMLVGSQRLIHRNLQAALLQQTPSLAGALADISAVQAALQVNIATLELFAIRLEQAFNDREASVTMIPRRGDVRGIAAVASLALIGSGWALYKVMLG